MKKIRLSSFLLSGIAMLGLYSCSKTTGDDGQGGQLPTHYVIIKDNSFSPSLLTVATGSSITFVNSTSDEHRIVSDDSAAIVSPVIASNTSFFYKKDTVGTINYHCSNHPTVTGTIILRP